MVQQLKLAFLDRQRVTIEGQSLSGESAKVNTWVCGPGAFIVIKALALEQHDESKRCATDLLYVLRNFGQSVHDVVDANWRRCWAPARRTAQ